MSASFRTLKDSYSLNVITRKEPHPNETLSPIRALLNSRAALGQTIFKQAEYLLDEDKKLRPIFLDTTNLPLGWYLSKASQERIEQQTRFNLGDCRNSQKSEDSPNAKTMRDIICDITVPEEPE